MEAPDMNEIMVKDANGLQTASLSADLYPRFIDFLDAKPATVHTYTRALKAMFAYFADKGIINPQRKDILSYREYLKETGHKPTTVQTYITATRVFFRWTASEELYPNIADHLKGAKLDRDHKKDYLTSNQVKTVLGDVDRTTPQGLRDYAILALMITGGLRTIEVVRANVGDISILGDDTVLFVQGKGRDEKTEYVTLSAPVEKAIREYFKTRSDLAPDAPLFTSLSNNSAGNRMTTRSISRIAKESMTAAGYNSDRLTAHSLRHTAVTLSLLGGESLDKTQQFARHADISTTQIYNHSLERRKNTCSQTISDMIFN